MGIGSEASAPSLRTRCHYFCLQTSYCRGRLGNAGWLQPAVPRCSHIAGGLYSKGKLPHQPTRTFWRSWLPGGQELPHCMPG